MALVTAARRLASTATILFSKHTAYPTKSILSHQNIYHVLSARRFASTQTTCNSEQTTPDSLQNVRNLGIIAHIDAGKTTTTERMLHYAGFTRSIGSVDDGDTVMDYLPAERERGITIQSAAITFGWRSHLLHLIDTPGHVDFTVEVERAMRVLDGAVAIVDAVAGVQAQTKTVWAQAARYNIPRVVFVNKMDRDGANWRKCVEEVNDKLGAKPLVLVVPECPKHWVRLQGKRLETWIDVVSMEKVIFDITADNTGALVKRVQLTMDQYPEAYAVALEMREKLVEELAEIDQQIVDVFFSDGIDGDHAMVPSGEIKAAIRRVTLESLACPVLLGASFQNIGVQPLLDAIVDYLPSPADRPLPLAVAPMAKMATTAVAKKNRSVDADSLVAVQLDAEDKLVAFAFKVVVDKQRGPMVFVRVYSGTLDARMTVVNATRGGIKERATRLLQMYADTAEEIQSIQCGHIGVILGLKQTKTGDTLMHPQHPTLANKGSMKSGGRKQKPVNAGIDSNTAVGLQLHGIEVPPPVFFCAVEADSPQDERPLEEALANLTLEDPSLHVSNDQETGQTLLSGMGELHLEVIRDRVINDLKINARFGTMRVSYREMPGQPSSVDYVYAKEIVGKAAKASMHISILPIEEMKDDLNHMQDGNLIHVDMPEMGLGSMEKSAVVVTVPANTEMFDNIRTAIIDGVQNALFRGSLLGFPVARSHVRITNIGYFGDELSTPAAYRACAGQAVHQALGASCPKLLEPIARATVLCPESHIGAVLSDLNGMRRGRVLSLDDANTDGGMVDSTNLTKVLVAEVPLSTMVGYSSQLRSLTAGCATFTMEVVGFGSMPIQQQHQVIKEARGYY
ncbi:Ribosome-releasing factor 2, mitochondrial [Coemansia sp. IMI 203386]|nr:Ribosome-releasing factor 2, mitochondrial [Coemansia sp. IMI 203386]